MRPLLAAALLLLLLACDPRYVVGVREPLAQPLDSDCIRAALLSHDQIHGATQHTPSPTYSITGRRLPDPVVFHFESDLGVAYLVVETDEEPLELEVFFSEVGVRPPPRVQEHGPELVRSASERVRQRCGEPRHSRATSVG